jgi:hypothetical protein
MLNKKLAEWDWFLDKNLHISLAYLFPDSYKYIKKISEVKLVLLDRIISINVDREEFIIYKNLKLEIAYSIELGMSTTGIKFILFLFVLFCLGGFYLSPQEQEKKLDYQLWIQDEQGNDIGIYSDSYALIIGVSDYTAGWPDLPGVAEDIVEIEKVLIENGFKVTICKNPDEAALITAIEDFIANFGHGLEHRLLIYFAGHGHTLQLAYGGDMGYIVPSDAPNPNYDKQGFQNKAVDMRRFDSYARAIESKHAMFLFDSCFSGSIFALSRAVPEIISYKTSRPVRQFITAGSADELVPDESIFKQQFIAGIQGEADRDNDGFITGTELGEFLQAQVVNYSEGAQHPQYGKIRDRLLDKGDFVFVLKQKQEEQITEKELSLTSTIELELWRSAKERNTEEAFRDFLFKFPDGYFSEEAKNKINDFQEREKKEVSITQEEKEPLVREAVISVTLLALSPEQIKIYNESVQQHTALGLEEEIEAYGQISLALSVYEKGNVLIESINERALNVTPDEKRREIRDKIRGLITRIVLDPPKDRDGNTVRVTGWTVSFSCQVSKGKLVLNKIGF